MKQSSLPTILVAFLLSTVTTVSVNEEILLIIRSEALQVVSDTYTVVNIPKVKGANCGVASFRFENIKIELFASDDSVDIRLKSPNVISFNLSDFVVKIDTQVVAKVFTESKGNVKVLFSNVNLKSNLEVRNEQGYQVDFNEFNLTYDMIVDSEGSTFAWFIKKNASLFERVIKATIQKQARQYLKKAFNLKIDQFINSEE